MTVPSATSDARGSGTPAPAARLERLRRARRIWVDRLAHFVVTAGGLAIIASILAIFVVIAAQVCPLLMSPKVTALPDVDTHLASPLLVGVDEHRRVTFVVGESGLRFASLNDAPTDQQRGDEATKGGSAAGQLTPYSLGDARVSSVALASQGQFALGLSDGRVLPIAAKFQVTMDETGSYVAPDFTAAAPLTTDEQGRPIRLLAYVAAPSGPIVVAAVGQKELTVVSVRETKALIGKPRREESRQTLSLSMEGEITALALDNRGEDLFIGTSAGQIIRADLRDLASPRVTAPVVATQRAGVAIGALGFLLGDRTLVVGDSAGLVSTWQLLRIDGEDTALTKIYEFTPHRGPVTGLAASSRDKGFVTVDASGTLQLHYGTTGKTLLAVPARSNDIRAVTLAPKADGILAVDATGHVHHWSLFNPHPGVSLRGLFGKVWYEGYERPEYVWQSTGGTDDFEAKFSLIPLIFGTLKGTFYALLFAVPIALLAALYASQFMHPDLKRTVKPTVEIMAALPSVVLGFIAGLWLAPIVEKIVPGIFLMPVVIPALILVALLVWQLTPTRIRGRFRHGTEIFLLVPVVCIGGAVALYIGGLVEASILSGDYRGWLLERLGLTYDQRNSLVVGFAMGFAVIPIIFTIAEDALSNVPRHLAAGSLALGATRWQTAIRVILPTASPGIFSAVVIGFGRAVGETMIVLMATGNTPVMDWSLFNGFRALSANIAVELPEAPAGGTLYRVLFFAALLLFAMTFLVNTAAELVRLRLRKKYRYL